MIPTSTEGSAGFCESWATSASAGRYRIAENTSRPVAGGVYKWLQVVIAGDLTCGNGGEATNGSKGHLTESSGGTGRGYGG